MIDQDAVFGDAAFQQDARAVGEQLPRGGDPERIGGIPLLGDQRGGHGVEVARIAGLQERRPARRACIERVQQHVAAGIEEGLRVAAHLVVDHAALALGADLGDQIGDQHGLARTRGARDDGVLGLGALRIRHPGDLVGPAGGRRQQPQRPRVDGQYAAAQLPRGGELGAADAPLLRQSPAPHPERREEDRDAAEARLEPEERARVDLVAETLAGLPGPAPGREIAQREHLRHAMRIVDLLERAARIPDGELGLGEGVHAGGVPFVAGGVPVDVPARHGDDRGGGDEEGDPEHLRPHAQPVEEGLAAAQRVVSHAHHDRILLYCVAAAPAGTGARSRTGAAARRRPARTGARGAEAWEAGAVPCPTVRTRRQRR